MVTGAPRMSAPAPSTTRSEVAVEEPCGTCEDSWTEAGVWVTLTVSPTVAAPEVAAVMVVAGAGSVVEAASRTVAVPSEPVTTDVMGDPPPAGWMPSAEDTGVRVMVRPAAGTPSGVVTRIVIGVVAPCATVGVAVAAMTRLPG